MAINPRQFFTMPSWVPQPDKTGSDEEPTETTLFSAPESTAAKDEGDQPKSSIIMEESTITDGLTTRTDSGKTITVPNNEVVTVTRHTTIVTDREPTLTTAATEPTLPPVPLPEETQPPAPPVESGAADETQGEVAFPTGAIIGVGVGGAALVALIVLLIVIIKRRNKKRQEEDAASTMNQTLGREDHDEKYFPQQMSAHTTGNTQATVHTRASDDVFAPFGGRVDANSEYPNRPASNTFEMDATPIALVELPDNAVIHPGPSPSSPVPRSASTNTCKTDPRAVLDGGADDDGNPKYVNQWNQYRAMGSN